MKFHVDTGNESLAGNALKGGMRVAVERQTPEEHRDLLDITGYPEYIDVLNAPNAIAKAMKLKELYALAQEMERAYPKYWLDEEPRRQVSQSSSFIGDFDYDPEAQFLIVNMNGKDYAFPSFTPEHVAEWLNSPSLGKYFNQYLKGKWG